MENSSEKKWFLYVVDHHEGPFSPIELQAKVAQGQLTSASYLWAEGMPDWRPVRDIPELQGILKMQVQPRQPGPNGNSVTLTTHPGLKNEREARPFHAAVAGEVTHHAPERARRRFRISRGFVISITLVLLIGVGVIFFLSGRFERIAQSPALSAVSRSLQDSTQPYRAKLVDKYPSLASWISPISAISDVSAEEYSELKVAAASKHQPEPLVGLALSTAQPQFPVFYVASNLPDKTSFDIIIEGIPETLLNQTSFRTRAMLTLTQKLGKTPPISGPEGRPLPRGEYDVTVVESQAQPPETQAVLEKLPISKARLPQDVSKAVRLAVKKRYFLGGPNDQNYQGRLKEYHDKLRERAKTELAELRQFTMTLDSQLNSSISKFGRLQSSRPTAAQKKSWREFHEQWTKLQAEMDQLFQKLTPEALSTEYYYGSLYEGLRNTAAAVSRLQQTYHGLFTRAVDAKEFQIQVGETTSTAQTSISELKSKLELAERQLAEAQGIPKKEGL